MEATFGGKGNHGYGPVVTEMKTDRKRSLEWDLNNWRWDGDLFVASPLNPVPSDCRSRQLFPIRPEIPVNVHISNCLPCSSDEMDPVNDRGKRELEKRRRVAVVPEEELNGEARSLNLKLGGQFCPMTEGEDKWDKKGGKKTKFAGTSANHPVCQVEDCRADLSNAKDYHRRHKVCEMHSKTSRALVGNVMQRFCQQCSRFHVLQEFDEGKRSCRRRLAGHNRRRRKAQPETALNPESLNDEQSSSYLLISLLRILSNLHMSSGDQTKDQDLLSHLLRNLASRAGALDESTISGSVQRSQGLLNVGLPAGAAEKDPLRAQQQRETAPSDAQRGLLTNDSLCGMQLTQSDMHPQSHLKSDFVPAKENGQETTKKGQKLNFDLNNEYDDSQDCADNQQKPHASLSCPFWVRDSLNSSPPQTSGNSDSTSVRSLSSSSGSEAQSRTERIVFKLFGKDPNDLPHLLRTQILDWLSYSPTEIEGYIRPGCVVLTVYLRLNLATWEELCFDLSSSLKRLLEASDDPFWRMGWIYTRVQNRVAFICNGQVVLDTSFPSKCYRHCQISSISPLAVSTSDRVQFVVRGFNVSRSTSRLLCALEGKYLLQENCYSLMEGDDTFVEDDETQCLSFHCSIPNVIGRGFIEVEDNSSSGSFFPFIVAEPDVCSEICTLEKVIEVVETADDIQGRSEKLDARTQALDFLHEMGWLLHRSCLRVRSSNVECLLDLFPFTRFKCLLNFSMDNEWSAVVKKLLDILLNGTVDVGGHPSAEDALQEMGLLHCAVRRNSRPMVESLLRYVPEKVLHKIDSEQEQKNQGNQAPFRGFMFRPDAVGPGGLTPLHIAAGRDGAEDVVEALIEDPGMVGIEAWKTARDSTGLTPIDYACLRGHYSYIHLVQRKTNRKPSDGHVAVDIPSSFSDGKCKQTHADKPKPAKVAEFQTEKAGAKPVLQSCKRCELKLNYSYTRTALRCRPAMLAMVAIAAVCVCAALLFKSSPQVYVFKPFCWDSLKYGAI